MTSTLPTHSKLGASSMHRWENCPGSVRLSAGGIKSPSSIYAAEGTVAHGIAAECLEHGKSPSEFVGNTVECEGHKFEVTEEMADAVLVYLTAVRGDYGSSPFRPELLIEHKFHLKDIHDDLYGTADCVALYREHKLLRVYDYKHGAGVAVDVENNPQLKYYAMGALLTCGAPIRDVEMIIVQPRCPHPDGPVRRHLIKAVDLLEFSADLLDAVHATEAPDAPLKDGDWCRWCPAAGICPQLAKRANETAKLEFAPQLSYDPKVLAETLDTLPRLEAWIESVRQFAYGEALHGRIPPDYKLVEKRATRKWIDEHTAEIELTKLGLEESDLYAERKILSPAQIEKKLGKANKPVLVPLVQSVSSGMTLVHASDNREAVKNDAQADFAGR
jgi:Protein of unknown function (DUF2800)